MSDDNKKNIISGMNLSRRFINPRIKKNQIIRAEDGPMAKPGRKIQIVGGDSEDVHDIPPTIVIEKDGDRISRIIVKCPCGRHSELACEYDDEENDDSGTLNNT